MMSFFESVWVIARRDFVASVFSRFFVLFLLAPLLLFGFMIFFGLATDAQDRAASQPVVAILAADEGTAEALTRARQRLVAATSEQTFPILRVVRPAENVAVQARNLLADESGNYSAVLSGTLERPVLTGPVRTSDFVGRRMQLLVEEKTNKIIEVLAASVPLDAIFLGKLVAMLGISLVGLALWAAMLGVGLTLFLQVLKDWISLPQIDPAVGWPVFVALLLLYYTANFMLLGALFLGIGGQATNIREIQTISMPVTLLQLMVLLLAITAVGTQSGLIYWTAHIFPFSSPMAMIALAAKSPTLWPHLLALVWQALWVLLIVRISSRLFQKTVLKSSASGSIFSFRRKGAAKS